MKLHFLYYSVVISCFIFIFHTADALPIKTSGKNFISYRQEIKFDTVKEFIIIANVGASNYFAYPIVISYDTIKNIPFPIGNHELYLKYGRYNNIIVSKSQYDTLFSYLNMFQNPHERTSGFVTKQKYAFIIDYKSKSGVDYELISLREIPSILFSLKNIYRFLETNNYPIQLLNQIDSLYLFYTSTHDPHNKVYKR